MPEQSFTIPQQLTFTDSNTQKQWRLDDGDAILVDDALTPTGETRYLRRVIARNDQSDVLQVRLQFGSDTTENAPVGGDDLVAAWEEQDADAIFFEQGAVSHGIGGPSASSNELIDKSEPYTFFPPDADQALLTTFFFVTLDTDADWTLRLNLAQVVPTSHAVDGGSIAVTVALPQPTVTHNRSHAVDGGSISVEVELPEPDVDHTAAGGTGTDHEISGGSITVAIALADPTVQHNRNHALDGGSIEIAIELPEPTVEVVAIIFTPALDIVRLRDNNIVLVDMTIGTDTYRYSDKDGIAVDGNAYPQRLLNSPSIESSIGSIQQPRHHDPRSTLEFEDTDFWPEAERFLQLARENNNLSDAVFTLSVGSGSDIADYDVIFEGRPLTPGGLAFERGRCTIQLVKNINRQNRTLPTEQFGGGVPEAFAFHYVPRVFGDYTAAPEQFLPTVNLGGGRYFIADPDDIQSIGTVKDGDGTEITSYTDNGDGSIQISTEPTVVVVSVVGAEDADYTDTGAGLAAWIIESVIGEARSALHVDFDDLHDATDAIKARAYFGEQDVQRQPQAIDELVGLLADLFYDLIYTDSDTYQPVPRSQTTLNVIRNIGATDLRPVNGRIEYDFSGDRVLANRLYANYALNPETGQYDASYNQTDLAAITRVGFTRTRTLNTKYFYTQAGPQNLADLWLFVFADGTYTMKLPLDEIGTLAPGDTILVGLDQFVDEPIQIRGTRWNLDRKFTELEGVSITLLSRVLFAPDTAQDYNSESEENKLAWAFFTDDSGDSSQKKYAPGGNFLMAYAEIANVTTDDPVQASVFNQVIENLSQLRATKFRAPYGTGSDYMGVRLLVDGDGNPIWAYKANTDPDSITLDNADFVDQAGSTSGPSF